MVPSKIPIIFWAFKQRPSSIMRGKQIADALSTRGHVAKVRFGSSLISLRDVKNSIIVCVKSRPLRVGPLLKRGNKLIYDAIDFSTLRGVPSQVHAVIAGSQHMKKVLRKILPEHVLVETIYHHADPLLKPHQAGEDSLKLAYIGEPESSKFIKGEIKDLNNVSFKDKEINWREEIRNYNAHFSARVDPTKSVIKLSNVSALGAVFLTGPEPGCVELLGDSYPFYLNTPLTQKSVSDDVDYLKSMVGTKLWREARAQIENVKPNLTLDATARAYENLILSQL